MLLDVRDRPGRDVGGGAHLQRDAVLGEVVQELRVAHRAGAVADALGPQRGQRVPDRLRPGGLTGVRYGVQALGDRPVEVGLELWPLHSDLGAAETEGDESLGPQVHGEPGGLLGRLQTGLARNVEAPAQDDPELGLRGLAGILYGLHERLLGNAAASGGEGGDGQFRVTDVLPRHVAGDLERQEPDVLRGADQIHDREVHVDEVAEVGEGEVVGQRLGGGGDLGVGMVCGQFGDDAGRGRADMVDMELGLGQPRDEGVQIGHRILRGHRGDAGPGMAGARAGDGSHRRTTRPVA